jgi:hypothetical protein
VLRSILDTLVRTASTTAGGLTPWLIVSVILFGSACRPTPKADVKEEPEAIARTEFTDRIENFFEYEPLQPGKPSQFLIHLTDLSDGSPVEKAAVTLIVRPQGSGGPAAEAKAKVGKVTGIYVAEVTVPQSGEYAVEFHVKNAKLDERMSLTGFRTEKAGP